MKDSEEQVEYQRNYYANIAPEFSEMNIKKGDEHYFALAALEGLLEFLECESLLDIGAGKGRVVRYFRQRRPQMKVMRGAGRGHAPASLQNGRAGDPTDRRRCHEDSL